jgi:hypothetical protein
LLRNWLAGSKTVVSISRDATVVCLPLERKKERKKPSLGYPLSVFNKNSTLKESEEVSPSSSFLPPYSRLDHPPLIVTVVVLSVLPFWFSLALRSSLASFL